MSKINIGQKYVLEISKDLEDIPCPWASDPKSRLFFKYVKWSDLHDKVVIVKAKTKLLTDYVVVELVDDPIADFTVPAKCLLNITYRLPIVCACDSLDLVRKGCSCGAFEREKRLSS